MNIFSFNAENFFSWEKHRIGSHCFPVLLLKNYPPSNQPLCITS